MMAAKAKNSLVANINKKKKAGTSKPKSKNTVSKKAYADMQTKRLAEKVNREGWLLDRDWRSAH